MGVKGNGSAGGGPFHHSHGFRTPTTTASTTTSKAAPPSSQPRVPPKRLPSARSARFLPISGPPQVGQQPLPAPRQGSSDFCFMFPALHCRVKRIAGGRRVGVAVSAPAELASAEPLILHYVPD